jgi:hypothetical protein
VGGDDVLGHGNCIFGDVWSSWWPDWCCQLDRCAQGPGMTGILIGLVVMVAAYLIYDILYPERF